jgi:arylsulfatase A-like enzyme
MKKLILFLATLNLTQGSPVDGSKPNIIFILSDDMGWNEPAFNGGQANLTPHITKLRSQGVSLDQFYVHAVCAPSRAAFLTDDTPFGLGVIGARKILENLAIWLNSV